MTNGEVAPFKEEIIKCEWNAFFNNDSPNYHYLGYLNDCFNWYLPLLKHIDDKIIIVSSHIVDELESIADDVIYMRNGQIVEWGDIESVKQANEGMSLVDIYRKIYGGGYYNA